MAKLPKYLKIDYDPIKKNYILKIKKWGLPIIVYITLKERFNLKWYHWLYYPYFCVKFMIKGA
jgi:hypothetical protein